MSTTKNNRFMVTLLGSVAALAVVGVLAVVLLGGGDDDDRTTSARGGSADGLPEFVLSYPGTWKKVAAEADKSERPRAVIQRKDGSGLVTMTINGPVKGGLGTLRDGMSSGLRKKFPGLRNLEVQRVKAKAGSGLMSTWVSKEGRVHSNLVVPSGTVSYSLDAIVNAGENTTAEEVASIYTAFDAEPAR